VPVEFLTDAQAAMYGYYSHPPSSAELDRSFLLDDKARGLIESKRPPHTRLGWADPRAQLLSGPAWETARGPPCTHVIDLIYRQDGGRRPEVIVTDTGSYSDMVWGLLRLLGFDYRPQLADLPDVKLWQINPTADYGPLNTAARGKINLRRIRTHWPDITRLAASIHTGAVSAHDVLRMLQHGGNPARGGPGHYGRIFKTLHVLSYVDEAPYRAQIKGIRNLQEGPHDLARHVYHEGMEDQLGALGLVLNCITLWNTVYLNHALPAPRRGLPGPRRGRSAALALHAPPPQRARPLLVPAARPRRHPTPAAQPRQR